MGELDKIERVWMAGLIVAVASGTVIILCLMQELAEVVTRV